MKMSQELEKLNDLGDLSSKLILQLRLSVKKHEFQALYCFPWKAKIPHHTIRVFQTGRNKFQTGVVRVQKSKVAQKTRITSDRVNDLIHSKACVKE